MENQDKHAVYSLFHVFCYVFFLSALYCKYVWPKFDYTHVSCSTDTVVYLGICFPDKTQTCCCTSSVVWIEFKVSFATGACCLLGNAVV